MVNYYEVHVIFQDTKHQLEENILYHGLGFSFYGIFIKLKHILNLLKTTYRYLLRQCPSFQIIYVLILKMWWFFIFIIISHAFVISFYILTNSMAYSTFGTFSNHWFFKAACHAILGAVRKRLWSSSYILWHIPKVFKYIS